MINQNEDYVLCSQALSEATEGFSEDTKKDLEQIGKLLDLIEIYKFEVLMGRRF